KDGTVWAGRQWSAGRILWFEDPVVWFSHKGSDAFKPNYGDPEGNWPVFIVPQEGDPASISAVSVAPDGRIWWSSAPWYNGPLDIAYGVAVGESINGWAATKFTYYSPFQLGMVEQSVRDLVALPDGRIVLAGAT